MLQLILAFIFFILWIISSSTISSLLDSKILFHHGNSIFIALNHDFEFNLYLQNYL